MARWLRRLLSFEVLGSLAGRSINDWNAISKELGETRKAAMSRWCDLGEVAKKRKERQKKRERKEQKRRRGVCVAEQLKYCTYLVVLGKKPVMKAG
ncbi:hypothetical protein V8C37DRAFT_381718 [Trichoderma ceciliae]